MHEQQQGDGRDGCGPSRQRQGAGMLQRPARFQHLVYMPGDRLTLAVRVGGEEEPVGAAHCLNDRLHVLFGFAVDLPRHRKIRVRQDRAVLGWQIADMAVACDDFVVAAEILVDGLRLCGRFDDDDFHEFIRSERQGAKIVLTQGNQVAGVTFDPAGEFQFEQKGGDGGG